MAEQHLAPLVQIQADPGPNPILIWLKKIGLILLSWWEEPIGVAVPLFALFIVLFAPQMPDMFAAAGAGLGLAAATLGFSAWYWTRAALLAPCAIDDAGRAAKNSTRRATNQSPTDQEWAREWAPRIALVVALLIALAPATAHLSWIAVVGGIVFVISAFLIVIYRQRLGLAGGARAYPWMWRWRVTSILAAAPFGWPVAVALIALTIIGSWIIAERPQVVEEWLAAPSAAIVALALVIPPFVLALAIFRSFATRVSFLVVTGLSHLKGAPVPSFARFVGAGNVFGLLLLLLWFFGPWSSYTHFELRPGAALHENWGRCPDAPQDLGKTLYTPRADGRPCITQALQHWYSRQRAAGYPQDRDLPVIIVAVEGGASRSAAWLLAALRLLDIETGNKFGRYLFAISGVSGGSLGAVTYTLAVHEYPRAGGGLEWPKVSAGMAQLAGGDLLSASIATYFLNDGLARLFGPAWRAPDRGVALELAFERLWQQSNGLNIPSGKAKGDLLELYADRDGPPLGIPHLFLNGTDEDTGRRLITSTVRFSADDDLFVASDDVLSMRSQDVHLSTAVTNSARFPYISPPGRITGEKIKEPDGKPGERDILDGGYFENYGARTAADLARKINQIGKELGWKLAPIVIVVSNDTDAYQRTDPAVKGSPPNHLLEDETITCEHWAPLLSLDTAAGRNYQAFSAGDDLVAPALGLYATRGAHGQDAVQELRRAQCPQQSDDNGRMIQLALPRPIAPAEAAPLNWALNEPARNFLLDVAPCLQFNRHQAAHLATILARITQQKIVAALPEVCTTPGPRTAAQNLAITK